MNKPPSSGSAASICWITDPHLDRASAGVRDTFFSMLSRKSCNLFVVTGDISDALNLPGHLGRLAEACAPRRVAFVLGNHDFYSSSFAQVEQNVSKLCGEHANLIHLSGEQVIPLDDETALIGHRGWADGIAGFGDRSWALQPDFYMIDDFRNRSRRDRFSLMKELGETSARRFRDVLPYALSCYRKIVIATHVPPFRQAVRFNESACESTRLPHYTNVACGNTIAGIAKRFPKRSIAVLSGHTHSSFRGKILPNLEINVGAARTEIQLEL